MFPIRALSSFCEQEESSDDEILVDYVHSLGNLLSSADLINRSILFGTGKNRD